jgi:hypothetical protein
MAESELEIEIDPKDIAVAMILNFMDRLDKQGVVDVYQEIFKAYCYKCGRMKEDGIVCQCE